MCDPVFTGVQMISRCSVGSAGLRMAFSTTRDRDVIFNTLRPTPDLDVEIQMPRLRSIRISGVPIDVTEAHLSGDVPRLHLFGFLGISMTTIGVHPRPVSEGATTRMWVLDGPEDFIQGALGKGRLYVGWHSYVIRESASSVNGSGMWPNTA